MQKRFKGESENGRYEVSVYHRNGGWAKRFDDLEMAKECATKISPTYKWDAFISIDDTARACVGEKGHLWLYCIDHKQANGYSNELEDVSYLNYGKTIVEVAL